MKKDTAFLSLESLEALYKAKYIGNEDVEELRSIISAQTFEIQRLHEQIMDDNIDTYEINNKNNDLEDLCDFRSFRFGMKNAAQLLDLGISIKEMQEHITKKYDEVQREMPEEEGNE